MSNINQAIAENSTDIGKIADSIPDLGTELSFLRDIDISLTNIDKHLKALVAHVGRIADCMENNS